MDSLDFFSDSNEKILRTIDAAGGFDHLAQEEQLRVINGLGAFQRVVVLDGLSDRGADVRDGYTIVLGKVVSAAVGFDPDDENTLTGDQAADTMAAIRHLLDQGADPTTADVMHYVRDNKENSPPGYNEALSDLRGMLQDAGYVDLDTASPEQLETYLRRFSNGESSLAWKNVQGYASDEGKLDLAERLADNMNYDKTSVYTEFLDNALWLKLNCPDDDIIINDKPVDFAATVKEMLDKGAALNQETVKTVHEKVAFLKDSLAASPDEETKADLKLWTDTAALLDQYLDVHTEEPTITVPDTLTRNAELERRLDILRTTSGVQDWATDGHDVWLPLRTPEGVAAVAHELSRQGLHSSHGGARLADHGDQPTLVFPARALTAMDEESVGRAGKWIGHMPDSYFLRPPLSDEMKAATPAKPNPASPPL